MSSLINFLKINYNIDETSLLFSYLFIYLFLGHAIHVYISMPFWQKWVSDHIIDILFLFLTER